MVIDDGGDDKDSEACHSLCYVVGTVLSSMNCFDS